MCNLLLIAVRLRLRSRSWRIFSAALFSFSVMALSPEPARANDAETADVAVDLFVKGSQLAGLPITTTEAEIIKQIVICGLSGTEVGPCVRNIAVATALKQIGTSSDMTAATNCLLDGKPAKTCIDTVVVARLPEEARPMVSCMISGQGNVAECSKKFAEAAIINKVPEDYRPAATCILETGNAAKCAKDIVIQQVTSRLPPDLRDQAKTIVDCLGGGNPQGCIASAAAPEQIKPLVACATAPNANVGQCMADFAAKDLPDGIAKNMIGCIGAGADFSKCAAQKGVDGGEDLVKSQISKAQQEAIQQALTLIDRLRPDAPYTIEPGRNGAATIKNIMMVADGIKKHDWVEFTTGAGPELIKIAGSIILSVFLTPPLAAVLSPAWEAMVNNDVAAANRALDAAGKGDAVAFAQTVFEWYENSFIDKPCALAGDSTTRDKICSSLSDAIKFISNNAADLAEKLLAAGKDVLEWVGLWGLTDDVATFGWNKLKGAISDVGHILGISSDEWKAPKDCGSPSRESPSDYLANHFLACLPKTAAAAATGRRADTGKLTAECNSYFNRCTDPKKRGSIGGMCSQMTTSLSNLTDQVSGSMATAAQAFADTGVAMASIANEAAKDWQSSLEDLCAADFWQTHESAFAGKCSAYVNALLPLAPTSTAAGATAACPALPTAKRDASKTACTAAFRAVPAAKKGAFAGPDSDLCKKQKEWIAQHPCKVENAGAPIPIPGGGQLSNIKVNCSESYLPRPFDKAPGPGPSLDGFKGPKKKKLRVHSTPEAEATKISPLTKYRPVGVGGLKKGKSAMDVLGDSMSDSALNNVGGNAGGPALPRQTGFRTRPSGESGSIASGNAPANSRNRPQNSGSGNIGLVNGASGNAPINKSRPANVRNNPVSTPDSGPDDLVNYGGCSSCNTTPRGNQVR